MPSHSFGIEYRDAALHNVEMPVLSNQNLLENFKSYLTAEKGLARLSVESYSHDLQQFAEFAEKNNRTLLQAERPNVLAFLEELTHNNVESRSRARKLSALRHFYKFLLLETLSCSSAFPRVVASVMASLAARIHSCSPRVN